jgi:Crinkler effector protein N-terminal domain
LLSVRLWLDSVKCWFIQSGFGSSKTVFGSIQIDFGSRKTDFGFGKFVVGEQESALPVDIEPTQLVGHLKKAIKAEQPNKITCDADELQLFLAKKVTR